MSNIINKIPSNYSPSWEGSTRGGQIKKIYNILGNILDIVYTRLLDYNGVYINDKNDNIIEVPKSKNN